MQGVEKTARVVALSFSLGRKYLLTPLSHMLLRKKRARFNTFQKYLNITLNFHPLS